MTSRRQRFAPLGLIITLIASLVVIGLLFVQRQWNVWVQIGLAIAILGLGIFALLDPERVRRIFSGRRARYSSNAVILSAAFLLIVVIFSYLVYLDTRENPRRLDLTEDRSYSLSGETLAALENLDEPVFAQAFYSTQIPSDQARTLLEQYKIYGSGKFDYGFIDPLEDPIAAEQANITQDGTIVFTMDDQQQIVSIESEEQFTSALVKLLNPDVRAVYFITGHGEYGLDDGEQSYSQVKRVLESKNYKVETLNLLSGGEIPEDAELIIIAAPQKPISQAEVEIIDKFLSAGNGLIVMQEPLPLTDFGESQDPLALYLTEQWGLTLGRDVVIDQVSQRPLDAVGSVWGNHRIVNNLGTYVVVFPAARSVNLERAPSGVSQAQLVSTTSQAWAETDFESLISDRGEIIFDETVDLPGPVPLAAVSENFSTDARVVVYGDADFSVDANFGFYANTDLFINSADWAAGEDDLIDLTPKTRTQRFLLAPQPALVNFIFLVTVVVIPSTALLGGIFTWFQRRKRG